MQRCRFKEQAYALVARVARAAASPRRLEILEVLAQAPRTVEALAEEAALSVANASQHLQALRSAGLVEGRKQGLYVEYRLADAGVYDVVFALRALAERRQAEAAGTLRKRLASADGVEAVSREELLARMRSGSVVVIDVRPRAEYEASHIEGAISMPLAELPRRIRELKARKEVIAYCRGPYCLMAFEATRTLLRGGRSARRLVDGFPEWRAAGLPVETAGLSGPARGAVSA